MKAVCHVNLARGFRGGERQTELLVEELAKRGVEQRLIVRRGSPLVARMERFRGLDIRTVRWPYLTSVRLARGTGLIHAHDGKAPHFAHLAHLRFGIPYIVTRRVVTSLSGSRATRSAYRRASRVVAVCEAVKRTIESETGRSDVPVISSALSRLRPDPVRVEILRERYDGKFVVGCAAALVHANKGQLHLIEAARLLQGRIPPLHLLLLGSGPDAGRLKQAAAKLPSAELPGFVDNLGDYLAIMDVFALPSYHEGFGGVLVDAMGAGLPIVATEVGGIPEVVTDGENGLLVPPGDSAALARALGKLQKDPGLRRSLAEAGRARASAYTPERMTRRYLRLYGEVMRREGPGDSETHGSA